MPIPKIKRPRIISLVALVDGLVKLCFDVALAQAIMGGDDNFDNSEVDIERQCLELVITQTPVASDWREIASCLKLVGDMERIADHATNIAQWVLFVVRNELKS